LDGGEVADVERDLLNHWGFGIGGAAAHQYDLMMVARVAGQECDAAVRRSIADDEAENLRVEVDHLRHVADIEPDMAEARRLLLRHCRSLHDQG